MEFERASLTVYVIKCRRPPCLAAKTWTIASLNGHGPEAYLKAADEPLAERYIADELPVGQAVGGGTQGRHAALPTSILSLGGVQYVDTLRKGCHSTNKGNIRFAKLMGCLPVNATVDSHFDSFPVSSSTSRSIKTSAWPSSRTLRPRTGNTLECCTLTIKSMSST